MDIKYYVEANMHYIVITKDRMIDTDKICSQEISNEIKACIEKSAFVNAEIFINASHFTIKVTYEPSNTRGLIWTMFGDSDEPRFWSDGVGMYKVMSFLDFVNDITSLTGEKVKRLRDLLKETQAASELL